MREIIVFVVLSLISTGICLSRESDSKQLTIHVTYKDTGEAIVEETKNLIEVTIPNGVLKAIQTNYPDYRIPDQKDYKGEWLKHGGIPFLGFADFDQNGFQDVVAMLLPIKPGPPIRVCAFNQMVNGKYKPFTISSFVGYDPHSIYLKASEPESGQPFFYSSGYETDGASVYWRNGKYQFKLETGYQDVEQTP